MAELIPNSFSTWELTEEEAREGSCFTIVQIQVLQNLLSALAEEKISIEFDPQNPTKFAQDEAYKKGGIDMLTHLIETSRQLQSPDLEY